MLSKEQRLISPHWAQIYDDYQAIIASYRGGEVIEMDANGNDLVPIRIARYESWAADAQDTVLRWHSEKMSATPLAAGHGDEAANDVRKASD